MSTTMPSEPFLNPVVYLNYLPPEGGHIYEISRDVTFVILGLMIWDILVYLKEDIEIIKRSRIHAPILCFIFSRVFAGAYILASSVQLSSSLEHQDTLLYCALALCAASAGCSTFLFLRRVQAVYTDQKYVRWFFSVLWVACFGCASFTFIEISPINIPGTNRFLATDAKPTFTISMYAAVAFDTCVFLATSYKFGQTFVPPAQNSEEDSEREEGSYDAARTTAAPARWAWWSTAISGKALPRLSRAILQSGQQYYLFIVVMTITAVILLLVRSVHPVIKGTVVIPLIPLTASMACRVFRNLKQFDHFCEDGDVSTEDLDFSV